MQTPFEEPLELWTVNINRASHLGKCGTRVLVISPKRVKLQYTLRFTFDITNNEAKYEALCAGLGIASSLRA